MGKERNHGAPGPAPSGRELAIALGLLYGATFALLGLSLAVPAVTGWLQAGLAVVLLAAPTLALRGTGLAVDDLGVQLTPWPRTAILAGLTMLIVFPLFTMGFVWFQGQAVGRTGHLSLDGAARWPDSVEGAPVHPCPRPGAPVQVWVEARGLWIVGPVGHTLDASVTLPGTLPGTIPGSGPGAPRAVRCRAGGRPTVSHPLPLSARFRLTGLTGGPAAAPSGAAAPTPTPAGNEPAPWRWQAPSAAGLWFPLGAAHRLRLHVRLDGRETGFVTGARQDTQPPGPFSARRSWWWVLSFLIVHLGLVALPEEWFFRGYLQARLDARLGTPWSLLGARVGWGFILAAGAFALLHPILVPGFYRLAVFFPGLLFGWLRARGGNIGAAVLVHAGANLLQALLIHMYV